VVVELEGSVWEVKKIQFRLLARDCGIVGLGSVEGSRGRGRDQEEGGKCHYHLYLWSGERMARLFVSA